MKSFTQRPTQLSPQQLSATIMVSLLPKDSETDPEWKILLKEIHDLQKDVIHTALRRGLCVYQSRYQLNGLS